MTVNELIRNLEAFKAKGKGDWEITIETRGKLLSTDEMYGRASTEEVIITTWG